MGRGQPANIFSTKKKSYSGGDVGASASDPDSGGVEEFEPGEPGRVHRTPGKVWGQGRLGWSRSQLHLGGGGVGKRLVAAMVNKKIVVEMTGVHGKGRRRGSNEK